MSTARRVPVFLCALVLLGGACAWRTPPLRSTGAGPLAQSSKILAADGSVITALHGEEDRETVALDRIPAALRHAVVAAEDERFWDHKGVDPKSVLRAVYANASRGGVVEGGSTITQQYVKNELVGADRTVRRKLREAALAYELERRYTKERILELYLNTIYFGNGAYGVQAAAKRYFGVDVEALSLGQSALLAALIRAPTATDPYSRPDVAALRRRVVLDRMARLGLVTPVQADAAAGEPLVTAVAPAERYPAPHFVEKVKRFVLDDPRFGATPEDRRRLLFRGGLRIHTTLDTERQAQAEAAVSAVLSSPASDPAAAVVSVEPGTGFVRALVGGRDFFGATPEAKFDLATQGRRPAASAFKPLVLAAALDRGIPLTRTYEAPPTLSIPLTRQPWDVTNYEGQGGGRMNLIEATVQSVNTVYAQLVLDVGPADAVATAARMGVASPLHPVPAAVLGANDVTPLDMATAYATLANRGLVVPPVFVTKVVDSSGRPVYEHQHAQRRVLDQPVADATVDVLRQVVERGTGTAARIGRPVAGKTGTGQRWSDAWFVGFTPELATAVWVGFPDGQRSMVPPATRILVTGGSWPAQIWQLYSAAALADVPSGQFAPPPPLSPSQGPPPMPVPAVTGMPVDQAEEALARDGLRAVRQPRASDDYPPGYVVAQSPPGDGEVPGGSEVVLEVSSGPATATVPDVLDRAAADAVARIESAGLAARVVVQAEPRSPGAGARAGRAWKQTPRAGTRTTLDETVTVYVNPG